MSADYFGVDHNETHDDVSTWQEQMRWRGWVIDVDGHYGPQSDSVCRAFQGVRHLDVDGLVGPATWETSWETPVISTEITAMAENASADHSEHGDSDSTTNPPEGELH